MTDILVDLEIVLVKTFHWSLHEIDETNIESLFPFINRFSQSAGYPQHVYADEVDWL